MLAALAMALLPLGSQAQLQVTPVENHVKQLPLKFPLISGGNEAAMWRINAWLQVSELEKLPGRYKKPIFEDVIPKPDDLLSITSMNYDVLANTPGYLSLKIESKYAGMAQKDYVYDYNFDAQSGRLVGLGDLFSPQGLSEFRWAVRASRLGRIEGFLAQALHDGTTQNHDGKAEAESAGVSADMFDDCRKNIDRDDLLILGKDTLTVSMDCAGAHRHDIFITPLDSLEPLENSYAFTALDGMLSDYGHCLLVEQRTDCVNPRHDASHGIWHGLLGKRDPITLVYGTYGTDGYFYDKFAKYIALVGGPQADGSLRFMEILRDGSDAEIVLKRQADGSFKGTWVEDVTHRTRDIELTNEL